MEDVAGPMLWLDQFNADIDQTVLYVMAAVSAINLVLAVIILILGVIFRADTPGSSTNFYVAFGSLALVACVLIQGLDPEYLTETIMEDLCQCYPTLLCFGLIAFTGGLLVRACHIFSFHQSESQKVHKQEWKPNMGMLFLLLVEAAPLLVWVMMFDMSGVYHTTADGNYTECTSDEYTWWKIGMSAYHAALIVLAAIMVWPAIYFSKKTPSEIDANMLSVCIYNMLFAAAAGTGVFFIYEASPTYEYAIGGGIVQYVVFMTLGLLIAAKLCVARKMQQSDGEGGYSQMGGGKGSPNSAYSRTNEDLYMNDSPAQSGIAETFSY